MYDPNLDEEDIKDGRPEYEYGTWKWIDSETIEVEYTVYIWDSIDGYYTEKEKFTNILKKLTEKELVLYELDNDEPEWNRTVYFSR